MIIGIDLGNYAIKTSQKDYFKNLVTTKEGFNSVAFTIDNEDFFIGEGEFSTDYNKAEKETTIPLLYYALAHYNEKIFDIIISLPIGQFKSKKNKLETLVMLNSAKTVELNGKSKDIVINRILVLPEGASAIYNLDKEKNDLIQGKPLLIIDIGGRTTDTALFINNSIKDIKTINIGTLSIYEEIVEEINKRYITEFRLEDGESILKNGFFYKGEYKDVSFIKKILLRQFKTLYKELQLKYDLDLGYIFLTGGGSLLFEKAFKNKLNNIILSDDPVFDNAIGIMKAGDQIWQS